MGKGQKNKNDNTNDIFQNGGNTYTAAKKEANGTLKKVGAWTATIAVFLFLVGMTAYQYLTTHGFTERRTVVLSTDNYEVTVPEMSYFFNVAYQNMYSYASYLGLDTTKSLKSQACSLDSNGGSWYDYLANNAKTTVSDMLSLCEAAKEAGIELDDEDRKQIEEQIDSLESAAKTAGYSPKEYIRNMYGRFTKEKDIRRVFELTVLANKYTTKVMDDADISDDVLESYAKENEDSLTVADYLSYTFNYKDLMPESETDENTDGSDEAAEDETAKADAIAKIATYADELKSCADADAFKDYILKYSKETRGLEDDAAESAVNSSVKIAAAKTSAGEDEQLKWIYEAKVGETNSSVKNDGETITVVMVTKAAGRDIAHLKNARHILFSSETYSDDSKVNEVYDKWVADGAKIEDFEALVKEYSGDEGSVEKGGLYENISRGDMVAEFNDWIFDESRNPGDHAIVKTSSYGWHIMYFEGESDRLVWQSAAEKALQEKAFEEAKAAAVEKYAVSVDEKGLDMMAS